MLLETFDNNGDSADVADKRAILVYRIDYDAVVDLLCWSYGKLTMYAPSNKNMDTALKLDEIKLLIEQHQSYLNFANDAVGSGDVKS